MEKTILVTGKDTFLGHELTSRLLSAGHRVSASVAGRKEAFPQVDPQQQLYLYPWNRRSAISAKNFLLETLNQWGPLDEVWVIFTPEKETQAFPDIPSLEMEEKLDTCLKGFLFLAREILAYRIQNPKTRLNFVLFDDEEDPGSLGALEFAAVEAFLRQLFLQEKKRQWPLRIFEGRTAQTDLFAQFLTENLEPIPGDRSSQVLWKVFGEKKPRLFDTLFRKEK